MDETSAQSSKALDPLYLQHEIDPTTPEVLESNLIFLQHEIDPKNPQFWELTLNFLTSLNKISPGRNEALADYFLCSLLNWEQGHGIFPMLKSLVAFVINEPEESSEDMQSLSEEIKVLLPLTASISANVEELYLFICLLKVEVFLKEQLILSSSSTFMKEKSQTKDLREVLNFVGNFTMYLPQAKIEDGEETFATIQEKTEKVENLYQSFHANLITEEEARSLLYAWLLEVVFTKAETVASQLLQNGASLMAFGEFQIETVNQGLELFEAFIGNRLKEITTDMNSIVIQFEAAARRVTSLFYSFVFEQTTEVIIQKRIILFSNLLHKMELIKSELREMSTHFHKSHIPKTYRTGFLDSLLYNIKELHQRDPKSIALVKHHIEEMLLDLESLKLSLMNILQQDSQDPDLKDLGAHFIDVAYEAEYVIDLIEVGIGAHWQHQLWITDLLQEIKSIKTKASQIFEGKTCDARAPKVTKISSPRLMQARTPKIDETVVCLGDQMKDTIDRLTRRSLELDIISIIGMPGIGKTTLARKVYNDLRVERCFYFRAWCSVSQEYHKRDLLLEILSNDTGLKDGIHQMNDEDLEMKLYQCLKNRKYLIVMDDVWDATAWRELQRAFPNDKNGSRILMTSRVSLEEAELKTNPYSLRPFSNDESWKLLQMKIFHGDCPEELLEVGKEIAEKCKGLPLAIVAIAGLLERAEKKLKVWKTIAESLSSRIVDDRQTPCMEILLLSYEHLPDHLKACFLYIGAFLEDRDIPVRKFIRLWIAEGFIQKSKLEGLEDLAEDYLMDLIGRSLVTVSRKRTTGQVKACRIHDLLRQMCLSKAKEENFLQLITRYDEPYTVFDDVDGGSDFYEYRPPNPVTYEKHRLFFNLKRKHFVNSSPSGPQTRSLIFFATTDTNPRRPYDISFISHHFKLLRVLDLESINIGMSFPKGIELLIQLRYLAVSGDLESIPPSIANLWKLETFIVKGLTDKILLPSTIWCMTSLRHLHVNNQLVFDLEDEPENSSALANLVTLSSPSFSYGKDTEKILSRLSNLCKLKCIFKESWDSSENCNQFPGLELLTELESLKIFYLGKALHPGELSFPVNLKKLTLSNFRLPWDRISAIGGLEQLEVLNLVSRAFEGSEWEMNEGEFLKLKFLKLDSLNIARWTASAEPLPNLEHLALRNCKDLEEVPFEFADIPNLQKIEVQFCGQSTEESVRKIEEEGIEGLKIVIH
ncbi:putative late blight resistance protein homolog R1A-3 [Coffea arabica]|uniref:Late blight resistance protein homolog R1A-3 n=1 Tax=Coffea arabica TaxID=13443 RepID=A0A6P6U0X8_COFAR